MRCIDKPITFNEVDKAINKLKDGKAPGLNGVPPKALKAMNTTTCCEIHGFVSDEGKADGTWQGSQ